MGGAVRAGLRRTELLRVVEAARSGDKQATNELVSYCLPQVESYVANRGAAHPEALANLVMAEFVRSLSRLEFRSPGQVWSYIYQVSRSRLVDERRKVKPEQATDLIEGVDGRNSGFDEHVVDEMWITDMLSGLTEDQRQVVELRFKDDLTLEETARRVGKTLTAVKGLQRRALATLAAVAAVIAIIWTVDASNINVQSSDPADVNNSMPLPGVTGLGPSAIDRAREMAADDPFGSGLATLDTRAPTTGEPGGVSATGPQTTAPVNPEAGRSNTSVAESPESTQPPTPPPSTVVTAPVAPPESTTPLGPGADGEDGKDGENGTPPPPQVAIDDVVQISFIPRTHASMYVDVLANDTGPFYPVTLRVVSQPTNGFVDLITGGERPLFRFYPTGPGQTFFEYEVCSATGCHKANVHTTTYWYTNVCQTAIPTIIGTPGNDVLVGTAGPDIIFGLGGDDTINGLEGDDIICGGEGMDIITGGPGADTLTGGPGEDDLIGGFGDDLLLGGDGDDFADGDDGADFAFGGEGNDVLTGGVGRDVLYGEGGDDDLEGGARSDLLFGGPGVDYLSGMGHADLLNGGLGVDNLDGGQSLDRVVGTEAHDVITADAEDSIEGWVGPNGCSLIFGQPSVCLP